MELLLFGCVLVHIIPSQNLDSLRRLWMSLSAHPALLDLSLFRVK